MCVWERPLAWGLIFGMANLIVQECSEGVVFAAKIVPGSSGPTRICGLLDGMLKVKVSAAPEKGKANDCLVKFLAEELGVKRNTLGIISGQRSPVKHVRASGMSAEALLKKLNLTKPDARR
ncbi:MAG: DUF167 domain-containing protein [Phycisphaerales bacterium]|nr:MAG: DUF167 domain-containing protein [Phycisphaerales bacterium]